MGKREKAIEICNNLEQTITKMPVTRQMIHKNETYEIPRAKKPVLIKMRDKLIVKYNLTELDLKPNTWKLYI